MRYIVFAVLLLGLVACESESEKQAKREQAQQEFNRRMEAGRRRPLSPEAARMLREMQQMQQQRQWTPPPQQPQQLVVCPECRGTGQASRDVRDEVFTENQCQYCKGHGTVIVGQGRRDW